MKIVRDDPCHPQLDDVEVDRDEVAALRIALIRMMSERDQWRDAYQKLHAALERLVTTR